MRARTRRLWTVAVAVCLLGVAAALVFFALRQNANLFYTPGKLAERGLPELSREVKVGGWVEQGSVSYVGSGAEMRFTIIDDSEHEILVSYSDIAPPLFGEGKGVMAVGKFDADGLFTARQVLAKHDENYQPRELKYSKPTTADPSE